MRSILEHPLAYRVLQNSGGFFGARLKAFGKYLPLTGAERIVDIGCGPGFVVEHLPPTVDYHGFDTHEGYIAFATSRFGKTARFSCRPFDDDTARDCGPVDVVMMNGVLHHLDDDTAHVTLEAARRALGPAGRLFTLDGCYVDGQSSVARLLLDYDRGKHVRTLERYRALVGAHFGSAVANLDPDLSWFPYTWLVMVGTGWPRT